jgi:serine/threonine-protein kinase
MSPEQVRGARDVDCRTDVYAFGVMLFEALTGRWPFDAETYNELILKIATEPPPRASDLNPNLHPELIAVIERAMARDPDARFPNIESLAFGLEPFAGGARFRITRATFDTPLIPGGFPVSRTPTLDSKHSIRTPLKAAPLKAAPQRSRAGVIVAALVAGLVLCAGVGGLMLRGRQAESASVAHPTLQPSAAGPTSPPLAAGKALAPGVETSVNAIQGVSALANATGSDHNAVHIVASKNSKRPVVLRDKRWIPDPPPPPEPVASKRLPKDWDERISTDTPRLTRAADLPAGRIDSHDFR